MNRYNFSHLSDRALTKELHDCAARERGITVDLLARVAEYDGRRLYRAAGYRSMHAYCIGELHYSESAAFKRITAARLAREHPVVLELIATGRLHLSGIVTLAPRLTRQNAGELFAAAAHKTRAEIEALLAARFPQPDLPERVEPVSPSIPPASLDEASALCQKLAPGRVGNAFTKSGGATGIDFDPASAVSPASPATPEPSGDPAVCPVTFPTVAGVPMAEARPRVTPLAPERYAIQVTVSKVTHDRLRRAQDLLRHRIPDGCVADILDRALELLVRDLEKRKFALTERPGPRAAKPSTNPRHVPAAVKRAVYRRDGGRCTFVGAKGRRCEARGADLEYDHALPIARGGTSTIGNLRLRCRAHNQLEAERTFGAELMRHKRVAAMAARA